MTEDIFLPFQVSQTKMGTVEIQIRAKIISNERMLVFKLVEKTVILSFFRERAKLFTGIKISVLMRYQKFGQWVVV